MLDHVSIGVRDVATAKRFYDAVLRPLGYKCLSEGEGSLVVTLFPDSGERYLSKLNEQWMREKGLLD